MAWGGGPFFIKIHLEAGGRELMLVAFWDSVGPSGPLVASAEILWVQLLP